MKGNVEYRANLKKRKRWNQYAARAQYRHCYLGDYRVDVISKFLLPMFLCGKEAP